MKKRILHLTLKEEWFDLIALGRKHVEYREVKLYWARRLVNKSFDEIYFKNGYTKDRPFMRVQYLRKKKVMIEGKRYYAIILGKVLEIKNWNKKEREIILL